MIEAGGKKSKDRSWQTFWCQLKGVALEFHRVSPIMLLTNCNEIIA